MYLSRKLVKIQLEILHAFLWIFRDHVLKISSNSEVVMLESSKKFVELTWNDPTTASYKLQVLSVAYIGPKSRTERPRKT